MHSTRSIIFFVLIMTSIVAIILAGMQSVLKERHDRNEALYNKKAILSAVADQLDGDFSKITDEEVQNIFDTSIEQKAIDHTGNEIGSDEIVAQGYLGGLPENIDMKKENKQSIEDQIFPLYIFTNAEGKKSYILTTRGKGLWDEIWGNIALADDLNTIAGVSFDHQQETPGLGAEIKDNKAWVAQFTGKKIYAEDGTYKSIYVRKGGAKDPVHEVDGISGATITADGVTEMLERGLKNYESYLQTLN